MLARLHSVTLEGIDGVLCEVEVDIARRGFEKPIIVGLPDAAVKESTERVRSAIVNCGYAYPKTQSIVNLAPADVKKAGPAFDLPIALGILIGFAGALSAAGLRPGPVVNSDFIFDGGFEADAGRPGPMPCSVRTTRRPSGFCRRPATVSA